MTKEIAELDELLIYAESAMADGYPYEVINESLALTVKALRAYRASLEPPEEYGECPTCRAGTVDNGKRVHAEGCPALNRGVEPK